MRETESPPVVFDVRKDLLHQKKTTLVENPESPVDVKDEAKESNK